MRRPSAGGDYLRSLLFAFLGGCSGASLDIHKIPFGQGPDMAHPGDGKRLSLC
jgi:hypothetical protein